MVVSALNDFTSELISDFLNDPRVGVELKEICYKYLANPMIEKWRKATPVGVIFDIFETYKKTPQLYDEIYSGRIKFKFNGVAKEIFPISNSNSIFEYGDVDRIFELEAFTRKVAEIFEKCEVHHMFINKISIKIIGNKLISVGFNHNNDMVTTHVDFLNPIDYHNYFIDFVMSTLNQRIDFIRTYKLY